MGVTLQSTVMVWVGSSRCISRSLKGAPLVVARVRAAANSADSGRRPSTLEPITWLALTSNSSSAAGFTVSTRRSVPSSNTAVVRLSMIALVLSTDSF
jgi:hypothetical protein